MLLYFLNSGSGTSGSLIENQAGSEFQLHLDVNHCQWTIFPYNLTRIWSADLCGCRPMRFANFDGVPILAPWRAYCNDGGDSLSLRFEILASRYRSSMDIPGMPIRLHQRLHENRSATWEKYAVSNLTFVGMVML